ncbi:MAG: indolepyruvate ferredoxin oxidoreductase, beta subunit [Eubacteriales bacterium]|nr:indolepyruvate ferredoxin oxidoreductase, beta subunit [Eubacteriales bacterium]MDN5363068.1 indolepyruvate ferredoxin oxidoreductase, beta subunit [Eubacteriales bacterium]
MRAMVKEDKVDMLLVGVGGQGTILASKVLAEVGRLLGYEVKLSEIHGMAQRGGSVVTHLRWGKEVFSPMVVPGCASAVVAFEKLEALRWKNCLRPGGLLLVNNWIIPPLPVLTGQARYPENIDELLHGDCRLVVIEGEELARQAGNQRTVNMVLLGALSVFLPGEKEVWEQALRVRVPAKFLELNQRAFALGRDAVARYL